MRTELPNGTWRRVVFSPWKMEAWDENDTVSDPNNLWYEARQENATPAPTDEEERAAEEAWKHRKTPTVTHFDNLGRAFLVQQFLNEDAYEDPTAQANEANVIEIRSVLDIEGQVREVKDAYARPCMRYTYAVDGQVLKQASIDAGDKWSLANVLGAPLRAWDAVGHRTRVELDVLQRPTHVWVKKGSGAEWLATRVYYGESVTSPEDDNLRGKAVLTFDGAGVVETSSFDFKGNALSWSRRLATAITAEPDWTATDGESTPSAALTAAASLLENETWTKAFAYDALNRVTSATLPDSSELLPSYNEAGLLGGVEVKVRGASTATAFVDDIDYDAHGRRTRIEYGNGTATEYFYDERTFRLTRIQTTRSADSKILQDLKYTYDPVGNIVEVRDDAHEDVFFNDAQVEPHQTFEYDALYRLVKATGREHAGGVGDLQRDHNDLPLWNLPHPNNAAALREYIEEYSYDKVGNVLAFSHQGVNGPPAATWTRTYRYDTGVTEDYDNNRLHSTSEPGGAWASYTHDANGNMVSMPHLAAIEYTHRDQMRHADLGGGGDAYYTYDTGGERVRKLIQRIGTTTEERIYLGGWELYRKRVGSAQDIEVERETLHVMDDTRRIAMVETLTVEDEDPVSPVVPRIRYQYGNHLDSAMLECDHDGDVISYEEYHPYGTAAYRSAKVGVEVSEKRYRYTGKERDEETGFSYHQWRYYAPWLTRWTGADPAGTVDEPSLYAYVGNNPVVWRDPSGGFGEGFLAKVRSAQAAVADLAKKVEKATDVVAGVAVQSLSRHPIAQAVEGVVDLVQGARASIETGDRMPLYRATPLGKVDTALENLDKTARTEGLGGVVRKLIPLTEVAPETAKAKEAWAAGNHYSAARHATKAAQAVGDTITLAFGAGKTLPGQAGRLARATGQVIKNASRKVPIFIPGATGGAGGVVRLPPQGVAGTAGGGSSATPSGGGAPAQAPQTASASLEPVAGGGARLSNLSPNDARRIQNAADRIGKPITLVGSRAKGTAGPASDWDYVIQANNATRRSVAKSLPGARNISQGDNGRLMQDIFNKPVNPAEPHIIFYPRGAR